MLSVCDVKAASVESAVVLQKLHYQVKSVSNFDFSNSPVVVVGWVAHQAIECSITAVRCRIPTSVG